MMMQPMKILLIVMLVVEVVTKVVSWMRMYPYRCRRIMQKPESMRISGRLMVYRTMQGRATSLASRARGKNQQHRVYAELQAQVTRLPLLSISDGI